jgi:prepilin-type N-terminal cleavage/methylation domain-containing protein
MKSAEIDGGRKPPRSLAVGSGRGRSHALGFTLVETLIVVSILGTVASAIYLSFSTGMEAQSRVEATSENLSRISFAFEAMAQDLTNPGLTAGTAFEGWHTGFRMGLGGVPQTAEGPDRVEYRLVGENGEDLTLVRRLLRGEEIVSEIHLAGGVDSLRVFYCMSDARGFGRWVAEWEPAWGLPHAVSVSLSARGSGERPGRYRRLIALAPSWLRPPIAGAVSEDEERS